MTDNVQNEYQPSTVTPPGQTLGDLLEERGIKQAELATRMDVTAKFVNELIGGKVSITPTTAIALEMALDVPADFWLARDARYQASLARVKVNADFASQVSWLDELPVADMRKRGWIGEKLSKTELVRECLRFFGVSTVDAWREQYLEQTLGAAAYRKSPKVVANRGSVATWLRCGEISGGKLKCEPFNRAHFLNAVDEARALTVETDPKKFIPVLQSRFAECGVAIIFVPAPKNCPVNGVARWLSSEKALVQLSFRNGTNDGMWFSFFHECGHIALHGKKMLFLENKEMSGAEEDEANRFAADKLIPPARWETFQPLILSEGVIQSFAQELGIHAGIVVGRLQTEQRLPWKTSLNHLKPRCAWTTEE